MFSHSVKKSFVNKGNHLIRCALFKILATSQLEASFHSNKVFATTLHNSTASSILRQVQTILKECAKLIVQALSTFQDTTNTQERNVIQTAHFIIVSMAIRNVKRTGAKVSLKTHVVPLMLTATSTSFVIYSCHRAQELKQKNKVVILMKNAQEARDASLMTLQVRQEDVKLNSHSRLVISFLRKVQKTSLFVKTDME